MQKIMRHYSVSDAEMLIAAATIIQNAIDHKVVLQAKRPSWKDPFFEDLKAAADTAMDECLGADNACSLRNATLNAAHLKADAKTTLAELQVQLQQDYKDAPERRDELLNELGFTAHRTHPYSKESVTTLLYQAKAALTPALLEEISANGTSRELLERINTLATNLKESQVAQENQKARRPLLTVAMLVRLNHIYDEVIRIGTIASKFMKEMPQAAALFSFNKAIRNMGIRAHQVKKDKLPPPATT